MGKRRTKKQKIKAKKLKEIKEERAEVKTEIETEEAGKKLIIKDLKKTMRVAILLLSLLLVLYWLEKTGKFG